MLADVIDLLADPMDGSSLSGVDEYKRLVSQSGHSFDVARQGYITLAPGTGLKHNGDDFSMVAARETFLSRGHFAPFVEAVSTTVAHVLDDAGVPDDATPAILEIGAGTGYYLSHVLDSIHGARGVGLDASIPAAKVLAKCHPRVGAVVADAWSTLPIRDHSIDAITVVFAPRNPQEFARVLKPHGEVVVMTPNAGHLSELRDPLGILDVESGKIERMLEQAKNYLVQVEPSQTVEFVMNLDQNSIATQIGMSPSARHIAPEELNERVAALPSTMQVTARASVTRLRRIA